MIHNNLTDIPHYGSLCQIYPAQEAKEFSECHVLAQTCTNPHTSQVLQCYGTLHASTLETERLE